jgi:hypothetical protein
MKNLLPLLDKAFDAKEVKEALEQFGRTYKGLLPFLPWNSPNCSVLTSCFLRMQTNTSSPTSRTFPLVSACFGALLLCCTFFDLMLRCGWRAGGWWALWTMRTTTTNVRRSFTLLDWRHSWARTDHVAVFACYVVHCLALDAIKTITRSRDGLLPLTEQKALETILKCALATKREARLCPSL